MSLINHTEQPARSSHEVSATRSDSLSDRFSCFIRGNDLVVFDGAPRFLHEFGQEVPPGDGVYVFRPDGVVLCLFPTYGTTDRFNYWQNHVDDPWLGCIWRDVLSCASEQDCVDRLVELVFEAGWINAIEAMQLIAAGPGRPSFHEEDR